MYRNRVKNDKKFFWNSLSFSLWTKGNPEHENQIFNYSDTQFITRTSNKKWVTFWTKCDPFFGLLTLYSSTLSKYNSWSSKNLTLVENAKSTIIVITGFLLGNFRLFPFPATNCSTMEFLRIPPLALTSSSSISFSDSSSLAFLRKKIEF